MAHCAPKQTYTVFNLNNDRKLQHKKKKKKKKMLQSSLYLHPIECKMKYKVRPTIVNPQSRSAYTLL